MLRSKQLQRNWISYQKVLKKTLYILRAYELRFLKKNFFIGRLLEIQSEKKNKIITKKLYSRLSPDLLYECQPLNYKYYIYVVLWAVLVLANFWQ